MRFNNVFIQLIYAVALICWGMLCFIMLVYIYTSNVGLINIPPIQTNILTLEVSAGTNIHFMVTSA